MNLHLHKPELYESNIDGLWNSPHTCIRTQGAQVWLADPAEVWLPGKVVEPLTDGHMVVEREKGGGCEEVMVCSSADLPPLRNPDILVGANDLTSLSYLHEPAG